MLLRSIILILIVPGWTTPGLSQVLPFRPYTTRDGLPSNPSPWRPA